MGAPASPSSPRRAPRPTPRAKAAAPTKPVNRPRVRPSTEARRAALAPRPKPGYLPGLDGLRAVSVAAVVAYHLDELHGGFLGVDVFFVVSGFLITRLLLAERERTGGIALGSFWVRRFKRLVPALLVVLVAVAIGSRLWLPAWRLTDIRVDALGAMAYVANWRFILSGQSYFASGIAPSPLRHTWSLAIEEQFYLLWPLVVIGAAWLAKVQTRRLVGVICLVGAVASASWMGVASASGLDLSRIYYGTDTRVFALFAGAWLATWWDPAVWAARSSVRSRRLRIWSWAGVVAIVPVLAFFVLGSTAQEAFYRGGFQGLAVAAMVVVAGVATDRGPLTRLLSLPPLVWVGRRSYGIYLWSWPIQVFAMEHFGLEGLVLNVTVVVLAVSLAALSFWLVEEPIRTGQRPAGFGPREPKVRTARPARVPRYTVPCVAVLVVVGVVVGSASGAPPPPEYTKVDDVEAADAAVGDISADEAASLEAEAATSTTVPIDEGPPGPFTGAEDFEVDPTLSVDPTLIFGRQMNVLVTGDSVGWSLGWELNDDITPTVAIEDRAIIGCGVMPRASQFIVGDREPEQYSELCDKSALAELKGLSHGPDVVLVWIGAWEVYDHIYEGEDYRVGDEHYAEFLEDLVQQRVDRARGEGAATILPLVPCFAPNAARLGHERLELDRLEWINDRLRAVAERNRGWVRLIDPSEVLCDPNDLALTHTPTGLPLREDGSHFDADTATWFWNAWLAGQIGAAFDVHPDAPPG